MDGRCLVKVSARAAFEPVMIGCAATKGEGVAAIVGIVIMVRHRCSVAVVYIQQAKSGSEL